VLPPSCCRRSRLAQPRRDAAPCPRRGADHGQAGLEYLVVVALIAAVLAVIGTVTVGPAIANGVGEAFQRALCRVTGDGCPAVARPVCTVRTAGTDIDAGVKVTFVRLGRTTGLLRTERSDGTVDVTLLDKVSGGLVASVGASGRLQLGGQDIGTGGLAEASAVAQLGGGRVWRMPDAAAADRLQRRLVQVIVGRAGSSLPLVGPVLAVAQRVLDVGSGADLPRPTSRILSGRIGVAAKLEGPLGSELREAAGVALGGSQDVPGGGGTVYLAVDRSGGAALLSGLADLEAVGEARVAVTVSRTGRPVSVAVSGNGRVTAGHRQELERGASGALLHRVAAGGGSAQVSATLDLTDPGRIAAVTRFVYALTHDPGGLAAAARTLGLALADGGRIDVATYRRREQRYGGSLEAGLGATAGVGLELTRTGSALQNAWTRPAGGAWERRADCLARV
jgi:hypothetical protein